MGTPPIPLIPSNTWLDARKMLPINGFLRDEDTVSKCEGRACAISGETDGEDEGESEHIDESYPIEGSAK